MNRGGHQFQPSRGGHPLSPPRGGHQGGFSRGGHHGEWHPPHSGPFPFLLPPVYPSVYPPLYSPIVPLPIPVPVTYPEPVQYSGRVSPVQREHDVDFRLLSDNLYIVTSPYLFNHVFSKAGDSFYLVGISSTGDVAGIRYFTPEEIDRIGVRVL